MRLQLTDKELRVVLGADEVLEWDGSGEFRVHPKLVRGGPWVSPVQDLRTNSATVDTKKFDGVTPEMRQK